MDINGFNESYGTLQSVDVSIQVDWTANAETLSYGIFDESTRIYLHESRFDYAANWTFWDPAGPYDNYDFTALIIDNQVATDHEIEIFAETYNNISGADRYLTAYEYYETFYDPAHMFLSLQLWHTGEATSVSPLTQSEGYSETNYDLTVTYTYWGDGTTPPNPVPEPAAILIFGTGLTGLISYKMRKKKQNKNV